MVKPIASSMARTMIDFFINHQPYSVPLTSYANPASAMPKPVNSHRGSLEQSTCYGRDSGQRGSRPRWDITIVHEQVIYFCDEKPLMIVSRRSLAPAGDRDATNSPSAVSLHV